MSEYVSCKYCMNKNCKYRGGSNYSFCNHYIEPKQTNADRIRSVSDEELEIKLTQLYFVISTYYGREGAKEYISNWLKREVSK